IINTPKDCKKGTRKILMFPLPRYKNPLQPQAKNLVVMYLPQYVMY
ncbi:porin AaxA domain protein, partial [Chlamydia psittaci C1/97]